MAEEVVRIEAMDGSTSITLQAAETIDLTAEDDIPRYRTAEGYDLSIHKAVKPNQISITGFLPDDVDIDTKAETRDEVAYYTKLYNEYNQIVLSGVYPPWAGPAGEPLSDLDKARFASQRDQYLATAKVLSRNVPTTKGLTRKEKLDKILTLRNSKKRLRVISILTGEKSSIPMVANNMLIERLMSSETGEHPKDFDISIELSEVIVSKLPVVTVIPTPETGPAGEVVVVTLEDWAVNFYKVPFPHKPSSSAVAAGVCEICYGTFNSDSVINAMLKRIQQMLEGFSVDDYAVFPPLQKLDVCTYPGPYPALGAVKCSGKKSPWKFEQIDGYGSLPGATDLAAGDFTESKKFDFDVTTVAWPGKVGRNIISTKRGGGYVSSKQTLQLELVPKPASIGVAVWDKTTARATGTIGLSQSTYGKIDVAGTLTIFVETFLEEKKVDLTFIDRW